MTDADADDLLRLFERIVAGGRHLAVMVHFSHLVELSTGIAQEALRRTRGAEIRMQAPLARHVNDDAETWVELCDRGIRLGLVPYYMFVERDAGPHHYFVVPLVRVRALFADAFRRMSGLATTLRGPMMSTIRGKVGSWGRRWWRAPRCSPSTTTSRRAIRPTSPGCSSRPPVRPRHVVRRATAGLRHGSAVFRRRSAGP